jgi:hypothetical protein
MSVLGPGPGGQRGRRHRRQDRQRRQDSRDQICHRLAILPGHAPACGATTPSALGAQTLGPALGDKGRLALAQRLDRDDAAITAPVRALD